MNDLRVQTGFSQPAMKPIHVALAVLVAAIWGVAFVVSKLGLQSFTPPQLTALRFTIAGSAAIWFPRPNIPLRTLIAIGLTLFTGQFLLQFFGISCGMPAGLTAVVSQTQALFTVFLAAIFIHDRPSARQMSGMLIAFVGLFVIGLTIGGSVTFLGFSLTLASATSWAVGNILLKRLSKVEMLHLIAWASLVPPLPALAISVAIDGPVELWSSLLHASWIGLAAPIYLGLVASIFAYAIWGNLLQHYSTGAVAPFALLAPCVGVIASAIVFNEQFAPLRVVGVALMLFGLAIIVTQLKRPQP